MTVGFALSCSEASVFLHRLLHELAVPGFCVFFGLDSFD